MLYIKKSLFLNQKYIIVIRFNSSSFCSSWRASKDIHRARVITGARITLVMPNEDMDGIKTNIKSLEYLNLMIHGISQTVESEII